MSFRIKEGFNVITDLKVFEQRLLKQSAAMMTLVAIGGTFMGILSNSHAILVDGIFSFVAVIIKLLMLTTSKLISRETSKRFQFGYWQFEPLVLMTEGGFTLLVIGYAFFSGVLSLINGGNPMNFGLAIYYAFFFTMADAAYFFYVRYVNKRLKSNLIYFDNMSWFVDAALSGGLLVSFCIAWVLQFTDYGHYDRYVDPLILIVLAIQMVPTALKILIPSVKQIMGVAPMELHNHVQQIMDDFMERYSFKDYVSSVQEFGNTKIIEIDILIGKNYPIQTVSELDRIRNEIDEMIGFPQYQKWVTISFTTTKKWMAKDYLLDEEEED